MRHAPRGIGLRHCRQVAWPFARSAPSMRGRRGRARLACAARSSDVCSPRSALRAAPPRGRVPWGAPRPPRDSARCRPIAPGPRASPQDVCTPRTADGTTTSSRRRQKDWPRVRRSGARRARARGHNRGTWSGPSLPARRRGACGDYMRPHGSAGRNARPPVGLGVHLAARRSGPSRRTRG